MKETLEYMVHLIQEATSTKSCIILIYKREEITKLGHIHCPFFLTSNLFTERHFQNTIFPIGGPCNKLTIQQQIL